MAAARNSNPIEVTTNPTSLSELLEKFEKAEMTKEEVIAFLSRPEKFKRLVQDYCDMSRISDALGVETARGIWDTFLSNPEITRDLIQSNSKLLTMLFYTALDLHPTSSGLVKVPIDKKPNFPEEFLAHPTLIMDRDVVKTIFLMKAVQMLMPADYISIKDLAVYAEKQFLDFLFVYGRCYDLIENLCGFGIANYILSDENAIVLEEEIPWLLTYTSLIIEKGQLKDADLFSLADLVKILKRFTKYQEKIIAFVFYHKSVRECLFKKEGSFSAFYLSISRDCMKMVMSHVLSDQAIFTYVFYNGVVLSCFIKEFPEYSESTMCHLSLHIEAAKKVFTTPLDITFTLEELPDSLFKKMLYEFFSHPEMFALMEKNPTKILARVVHFPAHKQETFLIWLLSSPLIFESLVTDESWKFLQFIISQVASSLPPHYAKIARDAKNMTRNEALIEIRSMKEKFLDSLGRLICLSGLRPDAFVLNPGLVDEIGAYIYAESACPSMPTAEPDCYRYYCDPSSIAPRAASSTLFASAAVPAMAAAVVEETAGVEEAACAEKDPTLTGLSSPRK